MRSRAEAADYAVCERLLAQGSRSFAAAGRLLPDSARRGVVPFYAFCRVADDLIDGAADPAAAHGELLARLDAMFAGAPRRDPVDRAMSRVLVSHGLPRAPFTFLLEGFLWDVTGRRYETFSEVRAYAVRVASAVGVVMTLLFGERRRHVLARATDLGLAMQLTNIARDVGEDARMGRLYLPRAWFREAGVDPDRWLAAPTATTEIRGMTARLLEEAARHYAGATPGIAALPPAVRPAVLSAGRVYAAIGEAIARQGFDTVTRRAYTGRRTKAVLLAASLPGAFLLDRAGMEAPAAPEAEALLRAIEEEQERT